MQGLISARVRFALIAAGVVLLALIAAGGYFRSREMARQAAVAAEAVAAARRAAAPAAPSVLVEVANANPPMTVQVLAARRVAPDTLRVELSLISRSSAREALGLSAADLCLLTADGSRRLFALRDAEDKPVGGGDFAPLGPNERRAVWALFPAPPAADTKVTLILGALTLSNVPIS